MSLLLPSEIAKLAEAGGKTHAEAMKILKKENPDWPEGDLADAANSVSPSMGADARRVQKRYQALTKSASTESPMMLPSELARLGKFPAGVSMTIDEVAAVVGDSFKEMNENPPDSVVKLREEMMDKTAASGLEREILEAMERLTDIGDVPIKQADLMKSLGLNASEKSGFVKALQALVDSGDLKLGTKGYAKAARMPDLPELEAFKVGYRVRLRNGARGEIVRVFGNTYTVELLDGSSVKCGPEDILQHSRAARFEEGPEGAKQFDAWMAKQPKEVQDDWKKYTDEHGDKFKTARYEEGQPADPTAEMSPEDAKKWEENTDKYKDKFTADEAMMDKFQGQLLPSESFAMSAAAETRRRSTWKNAEVEDDIGKKVKGPEESDKDEKFMKGQFTQVENSELSGKVAKGQKIYGHLEWLE
jgi:hypothetical protein